VIVYLSRAFDAFSNAYAPKPKINSRSISLLLMGLDSLPRGLGGEEMEKWFLLKKIIWLKFLGFFG
jgi:hypothetical protein